MNVAITGANRGIGLSLAKEYAEKGHRVFALCRHVGQELEKLDNVKIVKGVDVTDEKLGQVLESGFGSEKIDIFINNAGIGDWKGLDDLEFETLRSLFEVNALGPLNMVMNMRKFMSDEGKIGVLTSRMGSIGDNDSGGYYGYRMSKAAANAACRSLAWDLKDQGIAVAALHPGFVQTDMTSHNGDIKPDEAAAGLYKVMEKLSLENTGKFWHSNGSELPW